MHLRLPTVLALSITIAAACAEQPQRPDGAPSNAAIEQAVLEAIVEDPPAFPGTAGGEAALCKRGTPLNVTSIRVISITPAHFIDPGDEASPGGTAAPNHWSVDVTLQGSCEGSTDEFIKLDSDEELTVVLTEQGDGSALSGAIFHISR